LNRSMTSAARRCANSCCSVGNPPSPPMPAWRAARSSAQDIWRGAARSSYRRSNTRRSADGLNLGINSLVASPG
jgi:hypothetical protein